ncbi:MAG: NAD-dependent epimerase/dehydratase family protein [Lentisphaerae bacterium]|nr:NAD-dependent epimerase/dehydratase family protein [Lentisphaerota bacterium]
MRVLITGAGGFVGRHLIPELLAHGDDVVTFDAQPAPRPHGAVRHFAGDIRDPVALRRAIDDSRPDACVHLAALSFVPAGWTDPALMFEVNAIGAVNLLEAFRRSESPVRILVVSSAEVYGHAPRERPVREDDPMSPANIYAVTKASADAAALLLSKKHGLQAMVARPCNHIGPGQRGEFVVPSFARQFAEMARGGAKRVLRAGNLDSGRNFVDVRDVVRAYRLLLQKGRPGQAYNIGSGRETLIREVFERLAAVSGVRPGVEPDPARFRPEDHHPTLDIGRIKADTGWAPELSLDQTLRDVFEEAAANINPDVAFEK